MGKFNEMCKAYSKAIAEFEKYETECGDFFYKLINQMISYLEIPSDYFIIDRNNDFQNSPTGIDFNQDGYWHSTAILTIFNSEETHMKLAVKILFKFKKNANATFTVYCGVRQTKFVIDLQKVESYNNLFDEIYNEIVNYLNNNINNIYSGDFKQNFGFNV